LAAKQPRIFSGGRKRPTNGVHTLFSLVMLAQVSSVQAAWGDLVDGGTVTADSYYG